MEDYKNLGDAAPRYRAFLRRDGNTALEGGSERADTVQERNEDKDRDATEEPEGVHNTEGSNLENKYLAKPGLSGKAPNDMHGAEEARAFAEINPRKKNDYADSAEVEKHGRKAVKVNFQENTKERCDQDEEKEITCEEDVSEEENADTEKVEKHKSKTHKASVYQNVGWKNGSDEEREIGLEKAAVTKERDNKEEEQEEEEDEDSDDEEILPEDLLGFAWQIANGMVSFACIYGWYELSPRKLITQTYYV